MVPPRSPGNRKSCQDILKFHLLWELFSDVGQCQSWHVTIHEEDWATRSLNWTVTAGLHGGWILPCKICKVFGMYLRHNFPEALSTCFSYLCGLSIFKCAPSGLDWITPNKRRLARQVFQNASNRKLLVNFQATLWGFNSGESWNCWIPEFSRKNHDLELLQVP